MKGEWNMNIYIDGHCIAPKPDQSLLDAIKELGLNANTFSAAAYHLADAANAETLVNSLKDSIKSTQWMCGFPDALIVAKVGSEYVVSAFGNAEIIENFKNKLSETFSLTDIVYEESLTE